MVEEPNVGHQFGETKSSINSVTKMPPSCSFDPLLTDAY